MILENVPFELAVRSRGSGAQGLPQSEWIANGEYPVIGQGADFIEGWTNRKDLLISPSPSLVLYGGHTRRAKYVDFPFVLGPNVKVLEAKDRSALDHRYLFYFLSALKVKSRGYADHFPEVKRTSIPLQPINDQIRIAHLLGKVEALIAQRKKHLQQLDDLLNSVFLEMFGDPVRNEKGWDKPELNVFGKISTGNTPPRSEPANYQGHFIEWIKTDNITGDAVFVTPAAEHLSEVGAKKARTVTAGALLVACIAGSVDSIGRAALVNRKVSFNQQINAIQPGKEVNSLFLYVLFKMSRAYIQSHATKGMKKILTKGEFEKIKMIKPPIEIQNNFAFVAEKILGIKSRYLQSLGDFEALYGALSQAAFKGELNLTRMRFPEMPESKSIQMNSNQPLQPEAAALLLHETDLLLAAINNREELESLLNFWLESYTAQLGDKAFSVDEFMRAVEDRAEETFPDRELKLDADAYDLIKKWVFDALSTGRLEQVYPSADIRVALRKPNAVGKG